MISSIRKSLNSIPSTQKNTGFEKISLEQEKNYKGQLKVMNSYTGSDKVMNSYSGSEKIINIDNTEPATKNHNNSGIKKNKHDIVELLNLLDKCTRKILNFYA